MELKKIKRDSPDAALVEKLNNEAFPANERVSINGIFDFGKDGSLDILGIYDVGEFVGFYVIRVFGHFAYIAYFAVCPEKRSQGIGGAALRLLGEYYPERQIVVDFEAPDESCGNNAQRLRRRGFYYRNGFYETGWYQFYMETEFEIACSEPEFDKSGFDELIADIHARAPEFDPHLYRKDNEPKK